MFCRNCGEILTDTEVVCHQCGFALGTGEQYCEQCGTQTPPYAVVCEVCGTPIERSESPTDTGQFAYAPPPRQTYQQTEQPQSYQQTNRQNAYQQQGYQQISPEYQQSASPYDRGQPAYGQPFYPPPNAQQQSPYPNPRARVQFAGGAVKSKKLVGIFGIVLGMFGVHDFYLGRISKGIGHLVMLGVGLGFFSWIWAVAETMQILHDPNATDEKGLPLQ